MFRLLRFFSITSLISIVITAVLLVVLYQQLMIRQTVQLTQRSNLDLAQSLLTSVRSELNEYLASVESVDPREVVTQALSARALDLFNTVMRETSVVRIKLYNDRGVVVFSTDAAQIGNDQVENAGVISARNGRVAGGLTYHGEIDKFDREMQTDNVIETYVPVRSEPSGPIRGVFEIYTQANPLISQHQQAALIALAGVVLILLAHYSSLIVAARRAKNIIEAQQHIISDRTRVLEKLSSDMMKSEENDRQRLAVGLREGLAQTLCAIKSGIQQSLERTSAGDPTGEPLKPMIPALQEAIDLVRSITTELRPPSLDDLGLLPTVHWLCHELENKHPEIAIDREIALQETDVPGPLKIVIYRIIELALREICGYAHLDRIRLAMRLAGSSIILTIDDLLDVPFYAATAQVDLDAVRSRFAILQERATLSGGMLTVTRNDAGGTTLLATWTLPATGL